MVAVSFIGGGNRSTHRKPGILVWYNQLRLTSFVYTEFIYYCNQIQKHPSINKSNIHRVQMEFDCISVIYYLCTYCNSYYYFQYLNKKILTVSFVFKLLKEYAIRSQFIAFSFFSYLHHTVILLTHLMLLTTYFIKKGIKHIKLVKGTTSLAIFSIWVLPRLLVQ